MAGEQKFTIISKKEIKKTPVNGHSIKLAAHSSGEALVPRASVMGTPGCAGDQCFLKCSCSWCLDCFYASDNKGNLAKMPCKL